MGKEDGNEATSKTSYAVLVKAETQQEDVGTLYEFLEVVEESSSSRAMRGVAEKLERGGEYVAVPARSFAPAQVRLERTPRAVVTASQVSR